MAWLLVINVFLPLAGAFGLALKPKLGHVQARAIALGFALVSFALSVLLAINFELGTAGPQFTLGNADHGYGLGLFGETTSGPNVRLALGLDGISLWLFALSSLLSITAIFASWESITEKAAHHYALLLALETTLLGIFAALDVVLFYVFFEAMLIPMFFLIGIYGGDEKRRAAVTFFIYTVVGGMLTLLGVIALVAINANYGTHRITFSIPELTAGLAKVGEAWPDWSVVKPWYASPQVLIFLLLFAGFAIKVPMFPFHTWLPLAHVQAPTAGSIVLAGVMLKVGGYGFVRFNMAMTPAGAEAVLPLMGFLSVAGVIYGAFTALAQSDVKRLVAYSSVSHMGLIALGIFSATAAGVEGGVIQMINHGLTTGALFACVGIIYERYHTREMANLGGLWDRLPLFAFFLILSSMGSIALPGLNGFVGEFPILVGAFQRGRVTALLAATGMVLGAYYLLGMVKKIVFGPLKEPEAHGEHGGQGPAVRPVGWHEIAGLAPIMALIVWIGVYPKPFLDRIVPSVRPIVSRSFGGTRETPVELAKIPHASKRPATLSLAEPTEKSKHD